MALAMAWATDEEIFSHFVQIASRPNDRGRCRHCAFHAVPEADKYTFTYFKPNMNRPTDALVGHLRRVHPEVRSLRRII